MKKLLLYFTATLFVTSFLSGCGSLADRIETHIEVVGTELTEVQVNIDEMTLGIARGIGEIKGFTITNPEGYAAKNAIEMELLHLNLGIISTLAGAPLVLDKLVISYPIVNYEENEKGGSNLKDISDNTGKNEDAADRKSTEEEPASAETPGKPVRIVVKQLIIEGVTLNVMKLDGIYHSATLPTIELTDIGGDKGKKPGGLGMVIIGAMTGEMLKQAIARELIAKAGNIQEAIDADNVIEMITERYELTTKQKEQVRPVITEMCHALKSIIMIWAEQGYVDRKAFSKEVEPFLTHLQKQLSNILEEDQLTDLKKLIKELRQNSVEIIRFLAVNHISEQLDISPDQLKELRPVIRNNMSELSELIADFTAAASSKSFEDFEVDYQKIADRLIAGVANSLNKEQVEKLVKLQQLVLDKIRQSSFIHK